MGRRSLADRRLLITGASSGIGRALALELAAHRTHLLLVARRAEPLEQLASEALSLGASSAQLLAGDVTDPQFRCEIFQLCSQNWEGLDVLINNAGISAHGRFAENTEATLRRIMEVNFFAATELTRLALPLLRSGNDPIVVNCGSILGHRGLPRNCEYCASKFALRGWTESIRPELLREGIELLLVSPGSTDTEFFDQLISQTGKIPWDQSKKISAQQVAQQTVHAIRSRRREIFPNWRGRALVLLNRLCPRLVDRVLRRYG